MSGRNTGGKKDLPHNVYRAHKNGIARFYLRRHGDAKDYYLGTTESDAIASARTYNNYLERPL